MLFFLYNSTGIDYEDLNRKLFEIPFRLMPKDGDRKKGLQLSKEVFPILRKIYGEYHAAFSYHMLRHAVILIKDPHYQPECDPKTFLAITKSCVKITHGTNHRLYKILTKLEEHL